jgi:amino acid permease
MVVLVFIYLIFAIATIAYIVYDHKKLLEKYKYDKGEFTEEVVLAVKLAVINILLVMLGNLSIIVQIDYYMRAN